MITVSVGHLVILCFAGLLCWALISDALTMKIPNRISIGIVALYPAWVVTAWPLASHPLMALALAAAVLAAGFAAFNFRLLGGGDAKLTAAISLWAGPGLFFPFIAVTAIAGGIISIAVMLAAAMKRREITARGEVAGPFFRSIIRTRIPYGMAIASGGFFVVMGLWTG